MEMSLVSLTAVSTYTIQSTVAMATMLDWHAHVSISGKSIQWNLRIMDKLGRAFCPLVRGCPSSEVEVYGQYRQGGRVCPF